MRPTGLWVWLGLVAVVWITAVHSRREHKFVEWEELEKAENEESPFKLRELLKQYSFETPRKRIYKRSSIFSVGDHHVRHRKILDYPNTEVIQPTPPDNVDGESAKVDNVDGTHTVEKGKESDILYSGDSEPVFDQASIQLDGTKGVDGSGELVTVGEDISAGLNNVHTPRVSRSQDTHVTTHMSVHGRKTTSTTISTVSSTDNTADVSTPARRDPTHHATSSLVGEPSSTVDDTLLISDHSTHSAGDVDEKLSLTSFQQNTDQNRHDIIDKADVNKFGNGTDFPDDYQPKSELNTTESLSYIVVYNKHTTIPTQNESVTKRNLNTLTINNDEIDNTDESNEVEKKAVRKAYQTENEYLQTPIVTKSYRKTDGPEYTTATIVPDLVLEENFSKDIVLEMEKSTSSQNHALDTKQTDHQRKTTKSAVEGDTTKINNDKTPITSNILIAPNSDIIDIHDQISTLSFHTEDSSTDPISDIEMTKPTSLHSSSEDPNMAKVSIQTIKGLPDTYPTITDSLSQTTFHFTSDVSLSETTVHNIRVKRTTRKQKSPYGEAYFEQSTQEKGYNTRPQSTQHNTNDVNGDSTDMSNEHRDAFTTDFTLNQLSTTSISEEIQSTETPTTMAPMGWNESCDGSRTCQEGLHCFIGPTRWETCDCPSNESFSLTMGVCKSDNYWTDLEWVFSRDSKSKTLSVTWKFKSPACVSDIQSYTVKYWPGFQRRSIPKIDNPSNNTNTFRDLSVGTSYVGYVNLTLTSGKTLQTTEKRFRYCYDTRIQDIQIKSYLFNDKFKISYVLLGGCYTKIAVNISDDSSNTMTTELLSNYGCKSRAENHTQTIYTRGKTIDLKRGSSYPVEITQECVCDTRCNNGYDMLYLYTYPQDPTGLKVIKYGTNYLTISWDPPTEGSVDYYTVKRVNKWSNHVNKERVLDGEYEYNITGLQMGAPYDVSVSAVYQGRKSKGKPVTAVTISNVPGRPYYVRWYGSRGLLTWNHSERRNYAKVEYFIIKYACSKSGSGENTTLNKSIQLHLRKDECCNISVSGVNAKGQGPAGQTSLSPSIKVPTSPIAASDYIQKGDKVFFSWTLSQDTTRGTIYKFVVTIEDGGHRRVQDWHCIGLDCVFPCQNEIESSTITFDPDQKIFNLTIDVRPATQYRVIVEPKTAINSQLYSKIATFTTSETPPTSPVLNLTLVENRTSEARLYWLPPTESNGVVLEYNASIEYFRQNCSDVLSGEKYYVPVSRYEILEADPSNYYVVKGLVPFTNHTISVTAINNAGQGKNWSLPVSFKTSSVQKTVSLRQHTKVIGARSVELSWEPPCPLTEPLTHYIINVFKSDYSKVIYKNRTAETSIHISVLQPDTVYNIRIIGEDTGISMEIPVKTKIDGPVGQLTLTQEEQLRKNRRLFVKWLAPQFPNGVITGYEVIVNNDCDHKVDPLKKTTRETFFSAPASPECTYYVKVTAMTEAGRGPSVNKNVFIKAGVPPNPSETSVQPLVHQGERCDKNDATRTVPLNLPTRFLCDASYGTIKYRGILVTNVDKQGTSTKEPKVILHPNVIAEDSSRQPNVIPQQLKQDMPQQQGPAYHEPLIHNQDDNLWHMVLLTDQDILCTKDNTHVYRAACGQEFTALPLGVVRFVVGKESKCLTKGCNKFLESGTRYRFKAFVCTSAGCTDSLQSRIIQTEAKKSDKSNLVIGVLISIAVVVIIIVLAIIFYRKRQKVSELIMRVRNIPDEATEVVEMGPAEIPAKPISLAHFVDHVERMHQDSNLLFSEEYKLVTQLSYKYDASIAELPAHRHKNRYTNVLPFDHARVKLLPLDDDEPSDYINASFIPGIRGARDYIAAQGPLKATVDDFWRMIWEKRANAIVMLTQCTEKGKVKCEQYWPTDINVPNMYGDLQVLLRSESNLPDYVIRVMDLQLGTSKRTVHQFHFLKWPDFGCPEKTYLLLNLVGAVRDHTPYNPNGPMVIHCSAGVGRSGTYIALDTLLQQVKRADLGEVDIFSMVMAMRKNRPLMVQRENQYIYIHDCLRDALLDESDEENSIDIDDPIYQNT